MRLKLVCFSFAIASVLLCVRSFGQTPFGGTSTTANGIRKTTLNFRPRRWAGKIVSNKPYSAERVQESIQTLADGTHITHRSTAGKVFRDSQGRERSEWTSMPMEDDGVRIIEINDAAAGYHYVLDDVNKIAHRYRVEGRRVAARTSRPDATAEMMSAAPGSAGRSEVRTLTSAEILRPITTQEDLGTKTIDGVLAHGSKATTTVPAFSQGNDRPMVATDEYWFAEDLRVTVLMKQADPRMGETTIRLTNIVRSEPDPALFQPPADYKTVDETGPFTIEILRPAAH